MSTLGRRMVLAVALLGLAAGGANAAPVYVGSWEVDDGPSWTTIPPIYTGQEAAALLFGGSPSDYVISTVSSDPSAIDFMAWYSPWGGSSPGFTAQPNGDGNFPAGILASQSIVVDNNANGLYDDPGELSSYVLDWAQGSFYTNYAFRIAAVPEPSTLISAGVAGMVGLGLALRRRRARAAA